LAFAWLTSVWLDVEAKLAAQRAASQGQRSKSKVKAVKNFTLMSFGDEAEEDEEATLVATKKVHTDAM
jgi:hypothetical protein